MLKKMDFRRDLLTILYFVIVFAVIGSFFGSGNPRHFIGYIQNYYSLDEALKSMIGLIKAGLTEGSLGTTHDGMSYESVVAEYFKKSLPIIGSAFLIAIPLGMAKGIFDFRKKNGPLAPVGNGLTSFVTSLPDFFLIIVLQWIILFNFRFIDWFGSDQWYNFILPSILVSLYPLMYFARITSAALSNEEGQMYIQTARASGFTEKMVVKKHILKKCFVSILQYIPAVMTYVLSNLLMVEWLMDYKGGAWRFLYGIQRINDPKYSEAGLVIEFALCFMLLLFLSQAASTLWQHKYLVEKSNLFIQLLKIFVRYIFISLFIFLIILFI